MTLDEIISRAGGEETLAAILGVDRTTVYGYRRTRDQLIPARYARLVAKKLKIPLYQVRPDIWPAPSRRSSRDSSELVTA